MNSFKIFNDLGVSERIPNIMNLSRRGLSVYRFRTKLEFLSQTKVSRVRHIVYCTISILLLAIIPVILLFVYVSNTERLDALDYIVTSAISFAVVFKIYMVLPYYFYVIKKARL